MSTDTVHILMAEDSESDADLAREAFRNGGINSVLNIVPDGVEALDYVRGEGKFADRRLPDLIILDLNMPRKDGRAVLVELKADDRYKQIPIIILTTSQDENDITQAYDSAASCYVTKPMDFDKFLSVARAIKEFYFKVVTLPAAKG